MFVDAGHPEFDGADTIVSADGAQAVAEQRVWVYEAGGELAGFVLVGSVGAELGVKQISVSPAFGRRGIGSVLMRHVMTATLAPTIVLDTQADVAWNAPWYQQLGFEVVPAEEWTDAMAQLTREQTEAGFDWSTRVHMRWRRSSSET